RARPEGGAGPQQTLGVSAGPATGPPGGPPARLVPEPDRPFHPRPARPRRPRPLARGGPRDAHPAAEPGPARPAARGRGGGRLRRRPAAGRLRAVGRSAPPFAALRRVV